MANAVGVSSGIVWIVLRTENRQTLFAHIEKHGDQFANVLYESSLGGNDDDNCWQSVASMSNPFSVLTWLAILGIIYVSMFLHCFVLKLNLPASVFLVLSPLVFQIQKPRRRSLICLSWILGAEE